MRENKLLTEHFFFQLQNGQHPNCNLIINFWSFTVVVNILYAQNVIFFQIQLQPNYKLLVFVNTPYAQNDTFFKSRNKTYRRFVKI